MASVSASPSEFKAPLSEYEMKWRKDGATHRTVRVETLEFRTRLSTVIEAYCESESDLKAYVEHVKDLLPPPGYGTRAGEITKHQGVYKVSISHSNSCD